jgi:hypothetical protein
MPGAGSRPVTHSSLRLIIRRTSIRVEASRGACLGMARHRRCLRISMRCRTRVRPPVAPVIVTSGIEIRL